MNSTDSIVETDVVIIGGGPVGLAASLLLARHGVRSVVLEKNAGTATHPKASAFNTRTMEILRQLGIAEEIYEGSGRVGGVSFYTSLAGHKLGEISMADAPGYVRTDPPTAPLTWAQRLKRVFKIDITLCPLCGGQLRVIADITDPDLTRKILDHVNSRAPPRLPPRHTESNQTPPDLFAER